MPLTSRSAVMPFSMRRGVLALCALSAAGVIVTGQSGQRELRDVDYVEIQDAYGRSLHAAFLGDGPAVASTFSPDAELASVDGVVTGTSALSARATSERGSRKWLTNLALEPSRDGAVGWAYILESTGRRFTRGLLYRDEWLPTREGWRIRRRDVFPGTQMPPRSRRLTRSNAGGQAFRPIDYFEIQHLLTMYNVAWDHARLLDRGVLLGSLFSQATVYERPGAPNWYGRQGVIDYGNTLGYQNGLHHWDGNLLVRPGAEQGKVGTFGYDLLFYVDQRGEQVQVGNTGSLEHTFGRSGEGWLIDYRVYKAARSMPIPWPAPAGSEPLAVTGQANGPARGRVGQVAPADYVAIDQLYVQNNIAFDSGAEQGSAFARTFTPDGTWVSGGVSTAGTQALSALAAKNAPGLQTWVSNLTLEPSGDRVRGRAYVLRKDPKGFDVPFGDLGMFEDVLVKTPDGWRFASRTYTSVPTDESGEVVPVFKVDAAWPTLPNDQVMGPVAAVAAGADGHVWVLHRPGLVAPDKKARVAPPVVEFDERGTFVKAWGGPGAGYDWPTTEHGLHIDHEGSFWVTGSSPNPAPSPGSPTDSMVLKFDRTGAFRLQIGDRIPAEGNQDTKRLGRSTGAAVYAPTGEVFVADGYGNRRVMVFDAVTGAFRRMWGAFGKSPDAGPVFHGPTRRDPVPATGDGPDRFGNPVHCVAVSTDGFVYVCDRTNRRVQVFKADGTYVTQVFISRTSDPSAAGLAFSPDPEQRHLYVADYGRGRIVVLDRKTLRILTSFGQMGSAAGQFNGLHAVAVDRAGNVYTAEVGPGNRAQRFVLNGTATVASGTTSD